MKKEKFLAKLADHRYGPIQSPNQFLPYLFPPGTDPALAKHLRIALRCVDDRNVYFPCELTEESLGEVARNYPGVPWEGPNWALYSEGIEVFGARFRWLPVVELVDLLWEAFTCPEEEEPGERMNYRNDHGDDRLLAATCLVACEKWLGWGPRARLYQVDDSWKERAGNPHCWDATDHASLSECWSIWHNAEVLEVMEQSYRKVHEPRCWSCGE